MDEAKRREQRRRSSETIMIGGRPYREHDNGEACVLMPVDDPVIREREADARRTAVRVSNFIDNPVGGLAYGIATLAGATPQRRDLAFAAGATADSLMQGVAPLGAAGRVRPTGPRPEVVSPPLQRDSVRYGGVNDQGQARGVNATITRSMLGTGTRANPNLRTPGLSETAKAHNQARGHILASRLGGTGDEMFNLVTLTQNPTNNSHMKSFEDRVARKVKRGEVVEYSITPFYDQGILPPRAIFLTEHGSSSAPSARIIVNPAGRRK